MIGELSRVSPNQAMHPTAGRRTVSFSMTKTHTFETSFVAVGG